MGDTIQRRAVTTGIATSEAFRAEILASGVLTAGPVDGVYGRSGTFEQVISELADYITRLGADEAPEQVHYPPVLPRAVFEKTGYLSSFPDLMGSVHTFTGDERQLAELLKAAESGQEWARSLEPTAVMLCSAACHHVYPSCAGTLPDGGRRFQVLSWCFRHEPSRDLTRMQAFRQLEHVYVGDATESLASRDRWVRRGHEALAALDLDVETVVANDPFFGRRGRLLANSQREEELKFEIVTSFDGSAPPVAIASSNMHLDHFGHTFGITTAAGETAHSTCIGFGVDRIALALFHCHGIDPAEWPANVRARLRP
jgi:seryl-tRNA synthetase